MQELLRKRGVDYNVHAPTADPASGRPAHLPLTLFDDTELEPRALPHWVEGGPVEGCAFRAAEKDGRGRWEACSVRALEDAGSGTFRVRWADGQECVLHRLFVSFKVRCACVCVQARICV